MGARSLQKKINRQKESSWKGKLTDKEHVELDNDEGPYSKDVYTLYFETNEGKKIEINTTKDVYDKWKVGDKARKIKGETYPQKIA